MGSGGRVAGYVKKPYVGLASFHFEGHEHRGRGKMFQMNHAISYDRETRASVPEKRWLGFMNDQRTGLFQRFPPEVRWNKTGERSLHRWSYPTFDKNTRSDFLKALR